MQRVQSSAERGGGQLDAGRSGRALVTVWGSECEECVRKERWVIKEGVRKERRVVRDLEEPETNSPGSSVRVGAQRLA
jgi:hypothetical protein